MEAEIRVAQNDEAKEWDAILSTSPHSTLFHSWNWLKITEKQTRSILYPLIATIKGVPVGIIPLFFQKKGPIRTVFSPPSHTDIFYLGPILVGYDTLNQEAREFNYISFQRAVDNFIKNDLKAQYISISLPPNLPDTRPFVWSGYTAVPHFDYVIRLSNESGQLPLTLTNKQRQNLNRAQKKGLTIEVGAKQEYETTIDLMTARYRQQGKDININRNYYSAIYDEYKENLKIFVAKVNGEIVTGTIDFQYRDTHYSWIGNPKPIIPIAPSPNDLLICESVRIAQEEGFRYYVTMSAAGNKRLHSYYASKYNPELKGYFSVKKATYPAAVFEEGYSNVLKPLNKVIRNITSRGKHFF